MARFSALLSSILVAISVSSTALGAPTEDIHRRHATRGVIEGRGLEAYHPPSSFETFGEGQVDEFITTARPNGPGGIAKAFIAKKLGVDAATVEYRSGYDRDEITHAYAKQSLDGISFANAVANVALKGDKVLSFGSSFVKPTKVANKTPKIKLESVLGEVEKALGGKYNGHPTALEYLARPDGSAALVYTVQIQNEKENSWYLAYVDAHSGELLSAVDFTADASYRVIDITRQAFPDGLSLIANPQDTAASPNGWHVSGATTLNTSGNNVISFKSSQSTGLTTQSAANLFDYTYNGASAPSVTVNVNAARTNAFYIGNMFHDFTYRYGFTEAAFNFQNDNFGKGGSGNDRVTISVQDSSGTNNANFATPPDGQSGRARMYIWTYNTPNRDGSMSNDVLVHELGHGLTNRMTGGGSGTCLTTTQSRGLGEGWSDALADWTEKTSSAVPDFVLGAWVYNNAAGIRRKPYSTSTTVNNFTYASASGLTSVHQIGEIWANILHNVYARLVTAHGWSATARTNPAGTQGNNVWLHLFIDALALQPCNPTFVNARDAWIQADANRYGGANKCLLWQAFASRGLGVGAANYVNSSAVPSGC